MSVAWAKKTLGPEAVVQQNWLTVYVVSLMLWLPAGWERSGVAQKSGWLGRCDCTGVFVRHVTVSNFLKGVMLWPAMNCYGAFGLGYENFIHTCKMGPPWFQRVQFVGPLCFMPLMGQMCMWALNDGRNAEILQKHTAPQMPHESFRNNLLISNLEILRCLSNCSNLSWPCPKWCLASHLSAWGSPGHQVGAHPGFYQSLSEGLVAWRVQASKNRHFDGSIMNNITFIMHMYALIHFYNAICLRHSCQHLQPLPYRTNWMFLVASCMRRIPRISTNLRCHETS